MGGFEEKLWTPYFLNELHVRTYLQSLYVSIVGSNENAKTLTQYSPAVINWNLASGNELVRSCLVRAARWLRLVREFARSEDVFNEQFLEPARTAARFLLKTRELQPRTTSHTALLFARSSDFFDRYFNDHVSVLSLVVPELRSVLSLRCRTGISGGLASGMCEIEGVQPIPLVNRMHPARLSVRQAGKPRSSLEMFDFLKVSLFDLRHLNVSLSFENFCEVESIQFGRRHLGVPCVVAGRLESVQHPHFDLTSMGNKEVSARFMMTKFLVDQLKGNISGLRGFLGRPVRVLGVVWYDPRSNAPAWPEAFLLEGVDGEVDPLIEDLKGYVRLRGRVSLDSLDSKYNGGLSVQSLSKTPTLAIGASEVEWKDSGTSQGGVAGRFLSSVQDIRGLRLRLGHHPRGTTLAPGAVLDRTKLQYFSLAHRIAGDSSLLGCVNGLLRIRDAVGSLPLSMSDMAKALPETSDPAVSENLRWLRAMGFLVRSKTDATFSDRALNVIYLANKPAILSWLRQKFEDKEPWVDVLQLDFASDTPPSLLVRGLEELEKAGYISTVSLGNGVGNVLWVKKGAVPEAKVAAAERAGEGLQRVTSRILTILGSFPNPLGTLRVVELLRREGTMVSHFSMKLLLQYLRAKGGVDEVEPGMWHYPWKNRILDIFSADPARTFTILELIEKASIPLAQKQDTMKIIGELARKGAIIEVLPSKWAVSLQNKDDENKRLSKLLKSECRKFVVDILSGSRRMYVGTLLGRLHHFLYSLTSSQARRGVDPHGLSREVIDDMTMDGSIVREGDFVRLPSRRGG